MIFGVVLAINLTLGAYDHAKSKEEMMKVMGECKTEAKATDDDIKALMANKLPSSHEGLCMVECIFSKGKIMKNGKFDKASAIEVTTPAMKGDKDKEAKVKQMMEDCDKEIGAGDADKCVNAKKVVECIEAKGKSFGFKYPGQE